MTLMLTAFLALSTSQPSTLVIEATCGGGVAGRFNAARVDATGRVSARTGWNGLMAPVGTIASSAVKALSDRLDAAGFDTLASPPVNPRVRDGVTCTITRHGRVTHSMRFGTAATIDPADRDRVREIRAVLKAVLDAAARLLRK